MLYSGFADRRRGSLFFLLREGKSKKAIRRTFGGTRVLKFEFAAPEQPLSSFIAFFYRYEGGDNSQGSPERADVAHCRFALVGGSSLKIGAAPIQKLPRDSVVGPRNCFSIASNVGDHVLFGFSMLPAGWHALVNCGASQLADRVGEARDLIGSLSGEIRAKLSPDASLSEMVEAVQPLLRSACLAKGETPFWFINAVTELFAEHISPSFEMLIEKTGLSANRAERMLLDLYGASPKLFLRKSRALRVANRIIHGEGDWRDYVGDAFYDQSHCIREIKKFTGMTPAQLRDAPNAGALIQYRRRRTAPVAAPAQTTG